MELSAVDFSRVPGFLLMLTGIQLMAHLVSAVAKWWWLKRIGVDEQDRRSIFSSRRAGFELERLLQKYDERRLRIIDSICRKSHHVITGFGYYWVAEHVIQDVVLMVATILVQALLNLGFLLAALRSDRVLGLGGLFFGGVARIRDGAQGRLNLVSSLTGLFVQYVLVSLLGITVLLPRIGNDGVVVLIAFIYMPMVVGDAAGEIIGGTWGRQTLRVWGIGEINRKSRLGTGAVFASTLGILVLHIAREGLPMPWLGFALWISFSSAVVELVAPRSMDNLALPLSNTLWCIVWSLWIV